MMRMKRAKKTTKRFWEMTAAELAEATRQFNKPLAASRARAATKAGRARFEKALRAGSRIRRVDELGIDPALLSAAGEYARSKRISLIQLLERGLRRELASQTSRK